MVDIERIKVQFAAMTSREQLAFLFTASGPWMANNQIDQPFGSLDELLSVMAAARSARSKIKDLEGSPKYTPKKKKRRGRNGK